MKSLSLIAGISFAFCAALLPIATDSARILSIAFFSSKSHKITYEPLLGELAARGHDVTVLAPVVFGNKKIREIHTLDTEKLIGAEKFNMFELKEKGGQLDPRMMLEYIGTVCNQTYDLPHVKELMKEKFDLVIVPIMFNECALGYAYQFNAPLLIVSPFAAPSWVTGIFGTPSPSSFVANAFTSNSHSMTFYQRGVNLFADSVVLLLQNWYFKPKLEALYREKLNDPSLPSSDEILKERASLILSNSHLSLGQPRPFLPDIIEVGGMHCRKGKPLPQDLEAFVNSTGKDGFILFSMGSAIQGSMMPDRQRKVFLGAFARLKQKVLWKWETETMEDLPPNVKLGKWIPQQDVLGHPNIKAFITHGGFGSTTEAVYHGVPLIGIPMFGDQNLNMKKAENAGFAISLDYNNLTEDLLVETVNRILQESTFKERVQTLSKVFRDQPDKPLDRAVFWTEYVLRHKGAPHLRSPARELNFFQYHSLDVIALLITALTVILYIAKKVIVAIISKIGKILFGSSNSKTQTSSQKKKN